jgi:hypothetical protein
LKVEDLEVPSVRKVMSDSQAEYRVELEGGQVLHVATSGGADQDRVLRAFEQLLARNPEMALDPPGSIEQRIPDFSRTVVNADTTFLGKVALPVITVLALIVCRALYFPIARAIRNTFRNRKTTPPSARAVLWGHSCWWHRWCLLPRSSSEPRCPARQRKLLLPPITKRLPQ